MRRRTLLVGLGAPKAGTSWLWRYLEGHPDFYASPVKELDVLTRLFPTGFENEVADVRQRRMEDLILKGRRTLLGRKYRELHALARLGRIGNLDDYLGYFAERIGSQRAFGDITPSYGLLSREALDQVAALTDDVRFVFLMRDPASRTLSDILHQRRRHRANDSIDAIIDDVARGDRIYRRSDYGRTLDSIAHMGDAALVLTYEELFSEPTIRRFCQWLGLSHVRPDFAKRVNAAQPEELTPAQKKRVREIVDPIYRELAERFGTDRPARWQW